MRSLQSRVVVEGGMRIEGWRWDGDVNRIEDEDKSNCHACTVDTCITPSRNCTSTLNTAW